MKSRPLQPPLHRPLQPQLELIQLLGSFQHHIQRSGDYRSVRQQFDLLPGCTPSAGQTTSQPLFDIPQPGKDLSLFRNNLFGRIGRRQGSHVCDQIGQGDVNLMADSRNDRHPRFENRPDDEFLVEAPQILGAATSPNESDHIRLWFQPVGCRQSPGNFPPRTFALHPDGNQQHLTQPPAVAENL